MPHDIRHASAPVLATILPYWATVDASDKCMNLRLAARASLGCTPNIRARKRLALVTDVGALPNDWVTDPALLERVLTRLCQWGRGEEIPHVSETTNSVDHQQLGHPVFGVSCRRASPADSPDITMPSNSGRSLVACPPPLFRRPVGPTIPTSESGF
jgi:hypothetical protein